MTKRTPYAKEFKVEAVRLLELGDKKPESRESRGIKGSELLKKRATAFHKSLNAIINGN